MLKHYNILSKIVLVFFIFSVYTIAASNPKSVLFDASHGQLFHPDKTGELDLSELSSLFHNTGWNVKICTTEINDEVLSEIDALIISGAFKPFKQSEIEAIIRFIEKGGKLSVMLHIGSPFANLLHTLNVSISNGVIHETDAIIQGNDINFNVQNLKKHELFKKLNQFSVYGGWAMIPTDANSQIIAQTSETSWIDLNNDRKADAQQSFGTVIVGKKGDGHFVVFSDDAMFQNRFIKENNLILAKNLVNWLKN
jgi:hypothetical protein